MSVKNHARLTLRIYEVYALICSKCQEEIRVIVFIYDEDVKRKIIKHLNL